MSYTGCGDCVWGQNLAVIMNPTHMPDAGALPCQVVLNPHLGLLPKFSVQGLLIIASISARGRDAAIITKETLGYFNMQTGIRV